MMLSWVPTSTRQLVQEPLDRLVHRRPSCRRIFDDIRIDRLKTEGLDRLLGEVVAVQHGGMRQHDFMTIRRRHFRGRRACYLGYGPVAEADDQLRHRLIFRLGDQQVRSRRTAPRRRTRQVRLSCVLNSVVKSPKDISCAFITALIRSVGCIDHGIDVVGEAQLTGTNCWTNWFQ